MTPSEITKQWQMDNPIATAYHRALYRSRKSKIPFNLDIQYLKNMWDKQSGLCYFSGIAMRIDRTDQFFAISIDKLNPKKGYVQGNVVLVCNGINLMKRDSSVKDFLKYCRLITENMRDSV